MEVNSTFYRPIGEKILRMWARKVKGKEFRFTIKIPGTITHEKLIDSTNEASSNLYDFQKTHLEVLKNDGVLGAVLFQLPPYFLPEHVDKLIQLLSSFDIDQYKSFVEIRNRKLYNNAEFNEAVIKAGARIVAIDSPEILLKNNPPIGGKIAYIRLHGRNRSAWWKKGAGKDEKYDYEYNGAELREIQEIISLKASEGDEIFIYFNNHPSGKAARNALEMMTMTGLTRDASKQQTLTF